MVSVCRGWRESRSIDVQVSHNGMDLCWSVLPYFISCCFSKLRMLKICKMRGMSSEEVKL